MNPVGLPLEYWSVYHTQQTSAHVRQLHDPPGVTKRYHLDDLLLFVSHDKRYPAPQFQEQGDRVGAVQYSRNAMGEAGIWSEGQRGFDLTDIG